MGIRAEDVRVLVDEVDAPAGSFGATVALLEPIGSDTFVELQAGEATMVARVAPDVRLEIGQKVRAMPAPGRVHLFERQGGTRIIH
jgi:multiple sugar transport system ATP-binding protein